MHCDLTGILVIETIKIVLSLFDFSVNTISIAKPEKGAQIEAMIVRMAQSGKLTLLAF